MTLTFTECRNCGATLESSRPACNRCGERRSEPGSGRPQFTDASREAAQELGGLLEVFRATSNRVRYVGWCPAGALGIGTTGDLLWVADCGHMTSVHVSGTELRFGEKLADIETGRLLNVVVTT